MAMNSLGLGKGLDALIRETSGTRQPASVQAVPLRDIAPNPNQPRRRFVEKALEELAASIRSQGLLQPLLVRPLGEAYPGKYEIIAGERRWRASKLAGLTEVPVVVRNFSDLETLSAALIENLQREDLNPLEEALGMQMLKEEFGLSQDDLAQRLGKSRSAVANSLRLLSLPESFHKDLAEGKLSAGHGRALLSITSERAQGYLRNLILEESLSVREAEGLAATWKETGTFQPETAIFTPGSAKGKSSTGGNGANIQDSTSGDAASESDQDARPENGDSGPGDNGGEAKTAAAKGAPRKSTPQSAKLLEIQTRLNSFLSLPVRVTGKETKGKISLTYNSREELDRLLNTLALAAGDGSLRSALTANTHVELTGTDFVALPARNNLALNASKETTDESLATGAPQSDPEATIESGENA